jgi:hypothetical protein
MREKKNSITVKEFKEQGKRKEEKKKKKGVKRFI